jgi:hypothetical protein
MTCPCPGWCPVVGHQVVRSGIVTARRHEGQLQLPEAAVALVCEDYSIPGYPVQRSTWAVVGAIKVDRRDVEQLAVALRAAQLETAR